MDSNHQHAILETAVLPLELLIHKIGGDRGNRTLLVTMLARQRRSPLLPPIKKHTILTRQKSLRYTSLVCFVIGSVCEDRTHLITD